MSALAVALLAQLAVAAPRQTPAVLSFPEAGLDDSAAYAGYRTRFFRDAANNTVQIYIDRRADRVVQLWADAEDESLGFTARDGRGEPAALEWAGDQATVSRRGRTRVVEHRLVADGPSVTLGWFLLGSMRVERDFQYAKRQLAPFGSAPFTLPEVDSLLASLERVPADARRRHLALLGAPDVATLRARLQPRVDVRPGAAAAVARVVQPSLDGRDTLWMEFEVDGRAATAARTGDAVTLRARSGSRVPFTVRIGTTGKALTPLAREQIFTPEFLAFLAGSTRPTAGGASVRARRLERQVRGVELLSSREKLMAGLPTYATYFGRDMMVSTLMMRPIWQGAMSEAVIASVLRKLSPAGEVSHEEALGGQAVREGAAQYARLVAAHAAATDRGERAAATALLDSARAALADLRRPRENYAMIDDEFQLPVLAARWLADPAVPAARKRAFLLDSSDGGGSRLTRLLRELALVSRLAAPYAARPTVANLVSFAPRDSGQWASSSWRDSRAGYAGGRYAMDVNAIWVPHALEAVGSILGALRTLGLPTGSIAPGEPLALYARDSLALRAAVRAWQDADRHFLVRLAPTEVRARVAARVAAMPAQERDYWTSRAAVGAADSLAFLALALDGGGRPIAVANTDPATGLFLDAGEGARGRQGAADAAGVLRDVRLFARRYPVGLLVEGAGPVAANDAYASPAVWEAFVRDPYHGPRVVWGRELNLFLLGVAGQIAAGTGGAAYAAELRAAMQQVRSAAEASGFHSELWSYGVANGRLAAARYGTGADVQLWSTTDLAVQFALSRLGAR
jgi:hypothetical protein